MAFINNTVCVYVERAREQEQFENVRRIVRKSVRYGGGLYPNLYFFAKSEDDEAEEEQEEEGDDVKRERGRKTSTVVRMFSIVLCRDFLGFSLLRLRCEDSMLDIVWHKNMRMTEIHDTRYTFGNKNTRIGSLVDVVERIIQFLR